MGVIMNLDEIAVERLYNQHIACKKFKSPDELVSWLCAIQAQDFAGAKWSIGLRLPGVSDKDVESALKSGSIVRTWALRGTLHFLSANDFRWIMNLLAPRIIARNARRYSELGLEEKELCESSKILDNALKGGNQLNRRELMAILQDNDISTEGQRAAYILQRASLEGLICQSVLEKNIPVFKSTENLPKNEMKHEDALIELARRYFTSHGPATLKDYVWWSGLLVKDARYGLNAIKSDLEKVRVKDQTYWKLPSKLLHKFEPPEINLIPGFDDYLLSYRDRSASITPKQAKILNSTNGMFHPTILVNGQVKGIWKRYIRGDHVSVEIKVFGKLNGDENEILNSELQRYSEFLNTTAVRRDFA